VYVFLCVRACVCVYACACVTSVWNSSIGAAFVKYCVRVCMFVYVCVFACTNVSLSVREQGEGMYLCDCVPEFLWVL